jgi:hypothetical protein
MWLFAIRRGQSCLLAFRPLARLMQIHLVGGCWREYFLVTFPAC